MRKLLVGIVFLMFLNGCGSPDIYKQEGELEVVVTTTMLRDMVQVIGGERLHVTGMIQEGVDPHLYIPKPSDIRSLANADIIVYNGIHLEAKLEDVLVKMRDKTVIKAEDGIEPNQLIMDEQQGGIDPHIWFDLDIWRDVSEHIANQLSYKDPDFASLYEKNQQAYALALEKLEEDLHTQIETIPKEQRVLVTAHDAFAYLGRTFDIEVKAIQGISTQTEAGISDIKSLAEFIAEYQIPAVFMEASIPEKTMTALRDGVEQLGFQTDVGGQLYSDTLKPHNSFIETYRYNIETMVRGLTKQ